MGVAQPPEQNAGPAVRRQRLVVPARHPVDAAQGVQDAGDPGLVAVGLEDRKRLLRSVLREQSRVKYAAHVAGDGEAFYRAAAERTASIPERDYLTSKAPRLRRP